MNVVLQSVKRALKFEILQLMKQIIYLENKDLIICDVWIELWFFQKNDS